MVKLKYKEEYNIDISHIPNLSPLQSKILKNRLNKEIIEDSEGVENLIYPPYDIHKLYKIAKSLKDMDKLEDLLKDKINKSSHICIVSDFDCDGLTSAKVIEDSLKILGYSDYTLILNKRVYGTGVTSYCMDKIKWINNKQKIDVIILSDHGSSNEKEYEEIKKLIPDVKIILTDHHQVDKNNYPNSVDCFINPQREDNTNRVLKGLSGCAIAYLTMLVLAGEKRYRELEVLLHIVSLSTISDVMPLCNPINRYFVKAGLNQTHTHWPFLLHNVLDTNKVTTLDLSFKFIPIINTGNRTNNEQMAYASLNNDHEELSKLLEINADRKNITKIQCALIKNKIDNFKLSNSIIITTNGIMYSIAGNIAAKIGEEYNLPTVVFNPGSEGVLTGSIRGIIKELNIMEVLRKIEALDDKILIRYGGHHGAGGCSIHTDRLNDFRILFNKYTAELLDGIDLTKIIEIDTDIKDIEITPGLYRSLELIGPYGKGWEDVVFKSRLKIIKTIGLTDSISKVLLKTSSGEILDGICYCSVKTIEHLINETTDIVFRMELSSVSKVPRFSLFLYYIQGAREI